MVFNPVFNSLNSDYVFLYLPVVSYGYLISATDSHLVDLWIITVQSNPFYQIAALICLIGGLIYHKVFELIFGKSGPSNNPKKTSVVLKHMITLVLYCDVRDADNDIIDILEKATQRFRLKHVPRFVFFGGPALGMFLLTYLVVVLLYRVVVNSPGSYLGLALLIALGIGLLQPRIWAFFPNYVPPESASHLWTPEYIRGETKAEKKAAQRRLDDEWN